MNKPKLSKTGPISLTLKANTNYMLCTCRLSNNQPYCDGSHKDGDCLPIKLHFNEDSYIRLCGCKKTKNPPYCDGSHNK